MKTAFMAPDDFLKIMEAVFPNKLPPYPTNEVEVARLQGHQEVIEWFRNTFTEEN